MGGSLISWMSKTQPSVTLSSCEAEYVALSTCATEVKFVQMLFEELLPTHNTRPGTLLEDNTGTIHLVENATVGNRTKHIDVRYHHIREMYKEGRLQVRFVRSENNYADLMTKNVTEKIHKELAPGIKQGKMMLVFDAATREDVKDSRFLEVGTRLTRVPNGMVAGKHED